MIFIVHPYEKAVQKLKKANALKMPGLTASAIAKIKQERSEAIEHKKRIKDIFNEQKTKLDAFKEDQKTPKTPRI
jgi:hypothetical protein